MNAKIENETVMEQENTARGETQATEIISMLGSQCTRLMKTIKYI